MNFKGLHRFVTLLLPGVAGTLLLLGASCASLGDPAAARAGHVSSYGEELRRRSAWLDEPRSLEECLGFALENSYALRLGALQRRLSELDVDASFSSFLPVVSLEGSWTGWRHQQTMKGSPTADREYFKGGLGVQMPLVAPATWLLYANRRLERQAGALTEHLARQGIVSQVTTLYYQALLCQVRITALESQVASTRSQYERVSGMFQEGQVLGWERTDAETQWRSREISLEQALREFSLAKGQLLQVMGLSPADAAKLQLVYPREPRGEETESLETLVLTALTRRPELSQMDRQTVEAENQVRMALVDFLPTVGGFLNGTWTSDDIADRATNLYGGISAAMDLFSGFSKVTGYRSAKVARQAARLQREEKFLTVILEVMSAERDLRDAASQRRLAELAYQAKEARYQEYRQRCEEGVEPVYRMLDARAEMDDAYLALLQTSFVKDIALTNLEMATGTLTPDAARWTPEDQESPMKENLDELLLKE
ncbi:MAG: TolC family protein [Oligosphaeraceae bacterium]